MTANINPVFTLTPHISWVAAILTANNTYAGTGTVSTVFTAGSNGSFVRSVKAKAIGTTGGASVARIFINNGSTNTTATNNSLFAEFTLPSITATASAGTAEVEIMLNVQLPASYTLLAVIGTTVTNGWVFTAVGGDY